MDRVLILVDDEPNILAALQRVFRRDGYLVLTAGSGEAGLALLAEHPYAVVISDQRMPHMTGAEFLGKVKERFPETVRIILSGYTELNAVFDAINRGAVYRFLTKPWDDELLRSQVADAFEQLELRQRNVALMAEVQEKNQALETLNQRLSGEVDRSSDLVQLEHSSLDQFQHLLDALPIGIISLGQDGLIVFANQRLQRWLPELQGLTGRHLGALSHPMLQTLLQAALDGPVPSAVKLALPSGEYWLECLAQRDDESVIASLYPAHPESSSCENRYHYHCA